ncbi:Hypothetical protein A7982_02545 [Minicystis rosea]|nr:Hypothetical protein A7982_02545 [Minicystis rosea]
MSGPRSERSAGIRREARPSGSEPSSMKAALDSTPAAL